VSCAFTLSLLLFFDARYRAPAIQQSNNPTPHSALCLSGSAFFAALFSSSPSAWTSTSAASRKLETTFIARWNSIRQTVSSRIYQRMARNRIYSTLFYPNTLAGALLLFTPPMLLTTIRLGDRWRLGNASRVETILVLIVICLACFFLYLLNTHLGWLLILLLGLSLIFPVPRWVAPTILALGILAVLFWSGSKAGWLLNATSRSGRFRPVRLFSQTWSQAHGPGSGQPGNTQHATRNTSIQIPPHRFSPSRWPYRLLSPLLRFFKTGATSVSARFDYWRAAIQIAKFHPLFGTGPGTFQIPYEKIKRPEAEMARLTHNDYLQQASDSGIPGFLLYTSFIATALLVGARNVLSTSSDLIRHPPPSIRELRHWDFRHSSFVIRHLSLRFGSGSSPGPLNASSNSAPNPSLAWPAFTLLGTCGACGVLPDIEARHLPPKAWILAIRISFVIS